MIREELSRGRQQRKESERGIGICKTPDATAAAYIEEKVRMWKEQFWEELKDVQARKAGRARHETTTGGLQKNLGAQRRTRSGI